MLNWSDDEFQQAKRLVVVWTACQLLAVWTAQKWIKLVLVALVTALLVHSITNMWAIYIYIYEYMYKRYNLLHTCSWTGTSIHTNTIFLLNANVLFYFNTFRLYTSFQYNFTITIFANMHKNIHTRTYERTHTYKLVGFLFHLYILLRVKNLTWARTSTSFTYIVFIFLTVFIFLVRFLFIRFASFFVRHFVIPLDEESKMSNV